MKAILLFSLLFFLGLGKVFAQQVNGIIYQDTLGIKVIKVWGSHQQRGFALGSLTGLDITDMIVNYIKPQFGSAYTIARTKVIQGIDIAIPQEYKDEAQGVVDGMIASGTNPNNLDQTDILIGNCMLDLGNLLSKSFEQGCSTLMSWGDATTGTDLDGKSVASRHMDWTYSSILINHNVIIVHFPSEPNESKWLLAGYDGMISTLSGLNQDFGAFQQVLADFYGAGLHNKQYVPVWMAMRKALEASDYNNDGARNVQDLHTVLEESTNGFADGFIITSVGRTSPVDSLVAMVAELTPAAPVRTYRYNNYDDNIPGDNLYASNYQIARNNVHNYDTRYNAIVANIGDGTMMSLDSNWTIMRDHSHQSNNMQFMQYSPEMDFFRMSVWRNGQQAYKNEPMVWNLNDLFGDPTVSIKEDAANSRLRVYPNPANGLLKISGILPGEYHFEVYDPSARLLISRNSSSIEAGFDISSLMPGVYLLRLTNKDVTFTERFIKK
ncbi:MAG: T9SS type A sorting domain-containing protein [Bacteroidales bacterium]